MFLYISRDLIVYVTASGGKGSGFAEAIDLKTMQMRRITKLDHYSYLMAISPDLTKYWIGSPGGGDWYSPPSHLYLMNIPSEARAELLPRK